MRFFKQITPKQRTIALVCGGVILAILLTVYLLIPVFAKQAIHKKVSKVERERDCTVQIEQLKIAKFSIFGTFDIKMDGLKVTDNKAKETFLSVDDPRVKVQVWKGFHRTLILKNLNAKQVKVHVVKRGNYYNYHFLKGKKDAAPKERNYQRMVNGLLGKLGDYCPNKLSVEEVDIHTDMDSTQVGYLLKDMNLRNGQFGAAAQVSQKGQRTEHWKLSGNIDKKKKLYEGAMVCQDGAKSMGSVPFLRMFEQLDVQFHEAHGRLAVLKSEKKRTRCELAGSVRKLQCCHHYLADMPVRVDSVGSDLQLEIAPKRIVMDSSSTLTLNRAVLHPYICFENDKSKHVIFKIDEKNRDAEPLIASLPSDLFQIMPHLKMEGKMDFNCLLDCDFGQLDSLKFDFNLMNRQRSLRIVEGLGEITRFNEPFEYTFYDHGEPIRTVWIGSDNPYFCPSYEIPELLKQAILASEDGAFFVHNGFCKSSMQQALIDDIKAGKMRRGGSTITMQLVKNLFLSRKKVLTRKFEEMMLVWMIEDQHLISKDRMFEIYVNIIEWAPGVIGIGEASQFYFHKRPSELTMPECIYLASLIRAPKHYASTLNPDGTLTDAKRSELEFVADRMVIREFMTEAQRANFDSNVKTVIRRNDN